MRRLTAFALLVASTYAGAGYGQALQSQMDKMFGQMSSATRPGVVTDARRGVITGGSLSIRSPVTPAPANMVNFTPPSITAGCGGIDIYGGSFSYISGQQFVQTLRSIASNAEGLAFQMALEAMSNQLSQHLTQLSDKMLSRVNSLKTSCQIAHMALDNTSVGNAISSFGSELGGATAVALGDQSDANAASAANTPNDPIANQVAANHPEVTNKHLFVNVMWKAMQDAQLGKAFGSGTALEQELMSLTGTLIVCDAKADQDCAPSGDGSTGLHFIGPTLHLQDLVYGSTGNGAQALKCDETSRCMNPTPVGWSSNGFLQMVTNMLGTDGQTGIIGAMLQNQAATPQMEAFLSNAGDAGALLVAVGKANPNAMVGFGQQIAKPMALEMAHQQAIQMITAALQALQGISNPGASKMADQLRAEMVDIDRDYASMRNQSAFNVDAMRMAEVYLQGAGSHEPVAPMFGGNN